MTYQTSESKRYYTNRNCLITLLKDCEHILLLMVPLQVLLLLLEAIVALVLIRRWSFVRKSYLVQFEMPSLIGIPSPKVASRSRNFGNVEIFDVALS